MMRTHKFTTTEAELEMLGKGSKNFAGFILNVAKDFSIGDRIIFECVGDNPSEMESVTRIISGVFFPGSETIRGQDSGVALGWVIVEFLPRTYDANKVALAKEMFLAEAKAAIAFSQYQESSHPDDLKVWLDFDLGRARASEAARKAILGEGA